MRHAHGGCASKALALECLPATLPSAPVPTSSLADITDINAPPAYAFQQQNSSSFYMSDIGDLPIPRGQQITLWSYPDLAYIGQTMVLNYAVRVLHPACGSCWPGHARDMLHAAQAAGLPSSQHLARAWSSAACACRATRALQPPSLSWMWPTRSTCAPSAPSGTLRDRTPSLAPR